LYKDNSLVSKVLTSLTRSAGVTGQIEGRESTRKLFCQVAINSLQEPVLFEHTLRILKFLIGQRQAVMRLCHHGIYLNSPLECVGRIFEATHAESSQSEPILCFCLLRIQL